MSNVTFKHDTLGKIEMVGRGPWTVYPSGSISEIRDADGMIANPTVHQKFSSTGTKPNRNVIFASRMIVASIVETANSIFAAAAPETPAPVDGED